MKFYHYVILSSFLVGGCSDCKNVGDKFCLEKWEDNELYYLRDETVDDQYGPGKIGGNVVAIGWNRKFILVQRQAVTGGLVDGWMIVDRKTRIISGPYEGRNNLIINLLKDIDVKASKDAWREIN